MGPCVDRTQRRILEPTRDDLHARDAPGALERRHEAENVGDVSAGILRHAECDGRRLQTTA